MKNEIKTTGFIFGCSFFVSAIALSIFKGCVDYKLYDFIWHWLGIFVVMLLLALYCGAHILISLLDNKKFAAIFEFCILLFMLIAYGTGTFLLASDGIDNLYFYVCFATAVTVINMFAFVYAVLEAVKHIKLFVSFYRGKKQIIDYKNEYIDSFKDSLEDHKGWLIFILVFTVISYIAYIYIGNKYENDRNVWCTWIISVEAIVSAGVFLLSSYLKPRINRLLKKMDEEDTIQ